MPGLPSQQKAALAYTLARQATSSSALAVDGKSSPPTELKRARRGAKEHQRRRSLGAAPGSAGARKAAASFGVGGGAPSEDESTGFKFMNLTMDHSESIIKGVAPSGSGKTKMRRDREAAEKLRKFDEAVAAVERGDLHVGSLAEVRRLLSRETTRGGALHSA